MSHDLSTEKNRGLRGSNSVKLSTANAVGPLNLDDIQIDLIDDNSTPKDQIGNEEKIASGSDGNHIGMEQNVKCALNNSPNAERVENTAPRRRKIGVVEASDTVIAGRINARVLQKKFGENILSETSKILNKKL